MLEYHIYDVTIWIKGDNCKANVRQWDWHLDNQPSFYWPWKRVISNPSANPTLSWSAILLILSLSKTKSMAIKFPPVFWRQGLSNVPLITVSKRGSKENRGHWLPAKIRGISSSLHA